MLEDEFVWLVRIDIDIQVVHREDGLHKIGLLNLERDVLIHSKDATNHLDVGCWKYLDAQ